MYGVFGICRPQIRTLLYFLSWSNKYYFFTGCGGKTYFPALIHSRGLLGHLMELGCD